MRSIIAGIATLLSVVSVSATAPGRAAPDSPSAAATITVHVVDAVNIGEFAIDTAMAEAAELWKPHHIVLSRVPEADACLTVTISDAPVAGTPRTAWAAPLGAIEFSLSEVPDRTVHVSRRSIEQLLEYPGSPLQPDTLPRRLHDRIIGRVLGRIVAHEIGHFVLRFPAHAPTGLMAAQHTAAEFASVYRKPFDLNPSLESRLREILRTTAGLCTTS
jgi:hypothetical protein